MEFQEMKPDTWYSQPVYLGVSTDGQIVCVMADIYDLNRGDVPSEQLRCPDTWLPSADGENVMILCPFCPGGSRYPIGLDLDDKPCYAQGKRSCIWCATLRVGANR